MEHLKYSFPRACKALLLRYTVQQLWKFGMTSRASVACNYYVSGFSPFFFLENYRRSLAEITDVLLKKLNIWFRNQNIVYKTVNRFVYSSEGYESYLGLRRTPSNTTTHRNKESSIKKPTNWANSTSNNGSHTEFNFGAQRVKRLVRAGTGKTVRKIARRLPY